jgi:hypothetical protein
VYPIKHKLGDNDMVKNFMILCSLTRGMELDEVLDESDMMPFPRGRQSCDGLRWEPPPHTHVNMYIIVAPKDKKMREKDSRAGSPRPRGRQPA